MRADRRIEFHGPPGLKRNDHRDLLIRIADWNRGHPIGCEVWIEDGNENRQRATTVTSAFLKEERAVVGVIFHGTPEFAFSLDDVEDHAE